LPATLGSGNIADEWVLKFGGLHYKIDNFNISNYHEGIPMRVLIQTGFARMALLGVSMNSGFVGGIIVPFISMGIIAGTVAAYHFPHVPLSIFVSSFAVAIPAGVFPFPCTLTLLSACLFFLGVDQSVPVFVACITSFSLVCSTGLMKGLVLRKLKKAPDAHIDTQTGSTRSELEKSNTVLIGADQVSAKSNVQLSPYTQGISIKLMSSASQNNADGPAEKESVPYRPRFSEVGSKVIPTCRATYGVQVVEIPVTFVENIMVGAKLIDLDFRITKFKGITVFKDRMSKLIIVVTTILSIYFLIRSSLILANHRPLTDDYDDSPGFTYLQGEFLFQFLNRSLSVDDTLGSEVATRNHHKDMLYELMIIMNGIMTLITVAIHICIVNDAPKLNKTFLINVVRSHVVLLVQVPFQLTAMCDNGYSDYDRALMAMQICLESFIFYSYNKVWKLALGCEGVVEKIRLVTHTEMLLKRRASSMAAAVEMVQK
jgi:hypothetical protein